VKQQQVLPENGFSFGVAKQAIITYLRHWQFYLCFVCFPEDPLL